MRLSINIGGASLCIWMSACAPIDDGALTIRGRAEDAASVAYGLCLLDTRDAAGAIVDRRTVSGEFAEAIIIAPRVADYSFAISCSGADETYQSPLFRVGPSDRSSDSVDLGRIVLKRT
jgi:hypothetical protein